MIVQFDLNYYHCNQPELSSVVDDFIFWTEGGTVLQNYYFNRAGDVAPPSCNHTLPLAAGLHMDVEQEELAEGRLNTLPSDNVLENILLYKRLHQIKKHV